MNLLFRKTKLKEYTLNNKFRAFATFVLVLLISNITFAKDGIFSCSNSSQSGIQNDTNNYKEPDADYEGITFYEPMLSYEDILGMDFIFDDEDLIIQIQGTNDEQKN